MSLIALKCATFKLSSGEEEMYKELYLSVVNRANAYELVDNVSTSVGTGAFYRWYGLKSVSMQNVVSVGDYAFGECEKIVVVDFPNLTTIGVHAFSRAGNSSVPVYASFPKLTTINSNGFYNSLFTTVNLPVATSIPQGCFQWSVVVKNVVCPSAKTIYPASFQSCTKLETVDFRGATSVPSLNNISAFASTPATLKIIVPNSLYTDWIAAQNWSDASIVSKIVDENDVS